MLKNLTQYRLSLTAIFVLTAFLFWFAYSEIGQYTLEKQHPATQDYCQVAEVIKTEATKIAANSLFKLKVEKTVCMHCIEDISVQITSWNSLDGEQFYSPQKTTQVYLVNSTFLI